MDDERDWRADVLSRPPLRVMDDTTAESLAPEMAERLEALLASHNGCEPTEAGWRQLALALALQYEPAFAIETPADRASKGGRPSNWSNFILRSAMKSKMRDGLSQSRASELVAKEFGCSPGTARNSLTRKAPPPDFLARKPYEIKAEKALLLAALWLAHK